MKGRRATLLFCSRKSYINGMKHFRTVFTLILILILCLLVTNCGGRLSPNDAITAFCARYPLPAGRIYHSDAEAYDDTYLSSARFDLLYAREDGGSDREDIQSFALFFGTSLTKVSEMGIFLCPDRDAAYEVAGMLHRRIDTVRRMSAADTSYAEDARVELYSNYVVYTVLPDNSAALRTLARILS